MNKLHASILNDLMPPAAMLLGHLFEERETVSSSEFKETIARLHTRSLDRSLTFGVSLTIAFLAICAVAWCMAEFWNQIAEAIALLRPPHSA